MLCIIALYLIIFLNKTKGYGSNLDNTFFIVYLLGLFKLLDNVSNCYNCAIKSRITLNLNVVKEFRKILMLYHYQHVYGEEKVLSFANLFIILDNLLLLLDYNLLFCH